MSSWARPGVECVCIRDTPWIDGATLKVVPYGPVKNEYCLIEIVDDHPLYGVGLGLKGHFGVDGRPAIYPICFFKPIVEQPNDVALFAHHLDLAREMA